MKKGNLLLLIIALIIVIIVIIYIGIIKRNTQGPIYNPPSTTVNQNTVLEEVTDRNNYYMIENCVKKFYKYYSAIYENKNIKQEDINKTYNLLDEKYISFKKITKENFTTILPKIEPSVVNMYNMFVCKTNENLSLYVAEGTLRGEVSKEISNFRIMIQIDSQNETFSVLLQDYIEDKYPNLTYGNNLEVGTLKNIIKNRNNSYVLEEINDTTYILDLFDRYKEESKYNVELAYYHLDEEYRNKRFGTLENFQNYVKTNNNTELEQYQVEQKDGYTQYVGIDNRGHYYIFRLIGIKNYSLILDTYTIDLPEFTEKYNAANTVERVGYNIQKVLDAIDNKDYNYVYNKLYLEFKEVNYPTLEKFEKVIKNKLFDRNEVANVSSANEGSTYAYKLTIVDAENEKNKQDMTVVMQLKEGTDFVMSMSFNG